MKGRGFTVVELSICCTIAAVLIPLLWGFFTALDHEHELALWHLECADTIQTLNEELRLDRVHGEPEPGPELFWKSEECAGEIRYSLTESGTLLRQSSGVCGGDRVLATRVHSFKRVQGGVEITLQRSLQPEKVHENLFFIPLESSGAP